MTWTEISEDFDQAHAIELVCGGLVDLYAQLDDLLMQEELPELACKLGCSHCCNLLCMVMGAEAMLIAREVMTWWDKDQIKIALAKAALNCEPGVDRHAYRIARHGCVFLRDGLCRIYDLRPASCRWCIAAYSSEQCANPDATVGYLDTIPLQAVVWDYDRNVFEDVLCAPLPVAVLWALCGFDGSPEPNIEPSAWFRAHAILEGA